MKTFRVIACVLIWLLSTIVLTAQEPAKTPDKIVVTIENYDHERKLNLFEEQTLTATVSSETPELKTVELKCENKKVCEAVQDTDDPGKWLITVQPNSNGLETNIAVIRTKELENSESPSIANQSTGKIPVKIHKIIPTSENPSIKIGETLTLSKLLKISPDVIINDLKFTPNYQYISIEKDKYEGVGMGVVTLKITPVIGEFAKGDPIVLPVNVVPAEYTLRIKDKNRQLKGYVGEKISLEAEVLDENGKKDLPRSREIQWSFKDKDDQNKATIRELGDGKIEVDLIRNSEESIILEAKQKGTDLVDTVAVLSRLEPNVVGFSNVDMRLNVIDERTAGDLFGEKAIADYMVAKLRIYNKIPPAQNGGPSSSLLFFSEGLEVNVGLQKKVRDAKGGEKGWQSVSPQDIESINNWVRFPADNYYIRHFITKELSCNGLKEIVRIKTCDIDSYELERLRYFYEINECNNDKDCETIVAGKNWVPFRPHAFLIIASTHDRRVERSNRERGLLIANSLVSVASFATAFASPTNNSGYIFGFDKFSNLLVPAFEKLFPSRREVQRKNILDLVLQPYEEVSYGREVNKMVFIPRKRIPGILPNYDVRIVTVSVSKIKAEVSVIDKKPVQNTTPGGSTNP